MKKIVNYLILAPLAIILVLLSVANREWIRFSLDPLNSADPALSIELPFFVYLFAAFVCGMLIGGFLVWRSQGKHRKALREKTREVSQMASERNEVTATEAPAEIAPGLPMVTRSQ